MFHVKAIMKRRLWQMTLTLRGRLLLVAVAQAIKGQKGQHTANGDGLSSRARNIDDTSSLVLLNNSDRTNAYRICWPRCYHKIRTNPFIGFFLGAKS